MDAGERAKLIRDLDKAARDAASHAAFLSRKYREFMESDDPDMPPRDAVTAENGISQAMSGLADARQVLAKRARLLEGPPPPLLLHATEDPGQLDIIARAPEGDLLVGYAIRTASTMGDGKENWRARLTDIGGARIRASLGGHESSAEVMEHVRRFIDDHGPWWARAEGET
jgi:hypothetical protein